MSICSHTDHSTFVILACSPVACPRHCCKDALYWILPTVYPRWPTGTGHPLGCAGVDMSACALGSVCTISERPVKIYNPLSSNTLLQK